MESQQFVSEHDKSIRLGENLQGSACSSSESNEYVNEDVSNEKLYLRSNIVLPADCLTAVSMPKNWSQVERLKQQRLMLHQKLFSQKLNVKNDENNMKMPDRNFEEVDENCNLIKPKWKTDVVNTYDSFLDRKKGQIFENQSAFRAKNGLDEGTDSSDSDDFIPRLHISESCTSVENGNRDASDTQENDCINTDYLIKNDAKVIGDREKIDLDKEEKHNVYPKYAAMENYVDENKSSQNSLNNSDLCDISASKINEALFNTICSVSENKKHEDMRIKEVLNSLKLKAEVKENDHVHRAYKLEKPIVSATRMSSSPGCNSETSNINCSVIDHFPETNLQVVKNGLDIDSLSPTQYVGLPVDVDSLSKKYPSYTRRDENFSAVDMKQKGTTIIDSNLNSRPIAEHAKEPDYRNIALQKILALKRLNMNMNEREAQNDVQEKSSISNSDRKNESRTDLQSQATGLDSMEMNGNSGADTQDDSISTLPKKIKDSQIQQELFKLKQIVLNQRLQALKLGSCKKEFNAEKQKIFEAKQKMLEAELRFTEHKLEMAKKHNFFPKQLRYQRYCLHDNVTVDDTCSTDTDEELMENENRNSESRVSPNRSDSASEKCLSLGESKLAHGSKTSLNEVKSVSKIVTLETKDHLDQLKTECEFKSLQPETDHLDKEKTDLNKKNQATTVPRNEMDFGGKKVSNELNEENEPAGKVSKENELRVKPKRKRSCKKTGKSTKTKTKAKENNFSKRSSPGIVQSSSLMTEKIVTDSKTETTTSLVNPPIQLAEREPKQDGTSAVVTNSIFSDENTVTKTMYSSLASVANTSKMVLPQTAVLHNATKTPAVIKLGMQRQSMNANQLRQTDRFILPSGFVKDESSNQLFHTYHFNGQTFAMIDNKLYQIHIKFSDGKTKTVIGALIPTVASTNPTYVRPGYALTEFKRNVTTVSASYSRNTALPTSYIPSVGPSYSTSVRPSAQLAQKSFTYRLPVNNSSSAQSTQPLKLLIVSTNPNDTVTQSTQVIRQPLMHTFGSNNTVRAHLQQTLGQRVYTTSPSFVKTEESRRDIVRLPMTLVQTAGSQHGNYNLPGNSVPQNEKIQQRSPIESNNVKPTCAFTNTMYQAISPRTVKSLLTNKNYVVVKTSPEKVEQFTVQSKRNLEYCGSVVLSSASKSTILTSQMKQNSPSFVEVTSSVSQNAEVKEGSTLATLVATKADNSGKGLNELSKDNSVSNRTQNELMKTVSGTTVTVGKPNVNISQQTVSSHEPYKFVPRSMSPAKICSSMDSCIYSGKQKRKGTPIKELLDEMSSLTSKVQKMNESLNGLQKQDIAIKKDVHEKKNSDKESDIVVNEKLTEPVPFLDYPARIVSTNKSGYSKNLKEIVASPNSTVKSAHNSDTSLDGEKIEKMISFAKLLEEESNEIPADTKKLKRKRLLKKRRISEDVQVRNREDKGTSATDSEHESEESFHETENDEIDTEENVNSKIDSKETEPKQSQNKSDFQAITLEHEVNFVKGIKKSDDLKDRNMFDDLEQFVSKPRIMPESCNDSSASYDSSDLETYEKFVSNRKTSSDIMKPKSQFIESYYTNQGMKELQRRNIEPKYKVPITSSFVTSESSPKVTDLETSRSSLKEVEMELVHPIPENIKIPSQRTSLYSKSCSNIADIRQTQVEIKTFSKEDDKIVNGNQEITRSLSEISQKSSTVSGKQVKKLIKTKFIILKGEICDCWFDIKRKTGFGEMSDPRFIHYLLWSGEEKYRKKTQTNEVSVQTDKWNSSHREQLKDISYDSSEVESGDNNHVDFNRNINADSLSDDRATFSDTDFEATIVNVTDTPVNSPMLSDASTPVCGNLQNSIFFQSPKFSETASTISSHGKGDVKTDIPHGMMASAFDKVTLLPDCLDNSRKRHYTETEVSGQPSTKKQYPILSCATQRQMQWAVSLFREWLREKGEKNTQFECMDSSWLNDKLAMFYTDALSHEGTPYSTNILQTFRRALSLYLTSNCSSQNVRVSISQDQEYSRSNEILTELVFTEAQQNNVTVTDNVSYPITDEDMKKLYTTRTLSDDDPTSLMFKVWFDITYYLCKGNLPRNFWRSLTKRSLLLDSDVNGVFYSLADYVYIPPDEEPGKMYATPSEPEKCPVRSTSFYLSKLCANCEALFQCSKRSWHKLQERWYLPVPVSREKLDKMMSRICEQAQLSRVYDSSCVILTAKLKDVAKK